MPKKPLVSIVVPVYNMERYIKACVDSILNQVYRDFEVLIVNDGSTDASVELLGEAIRDDKRFTVLSKNNGGVSSARNMGIDRANGKYIVFVDADDMIHPTFLANLVNDMEEGSADVVTTPMNMTDTTRELDFLTRTIAVRPDYNTLSSETALVALYNGTLDQGGNGCQMIRLSVIKLNNLQFDSSMAIGEDFYFLAKVIIASDRVLVDDRELYFYRRNEESAVHKGFNIKHFQAIANVQQAGKEMKVRSQALTKAMNNNLFIASVSYGALMFSDRKKYSNEYEQILSTIRKLKFRTLFASGIKLKGRARAMIVIIFGTTLGLQVVKKLIRL